MASQNKQPEKELVSASITSNCNPAEIVPGEEITTMKQAAKYVTKAYNDAQDEFKVYLEMIGRVDQAPGDDLEALKKWRGSVVKDLARMKKRINMGRHALQFMDADFRNNAMRLHTQEPIARMRHWSRGRLAHIEAIGYLQGTERRVAAGEAFLSNQNVIIPTYKLDSVWEKALKQENACKMSGKDDLDSDDGTDIEE